MALLSAFAEEVERTCFSDQDVRGNSLQLAMAAQLANYMLLATYLYYKQSASVSSY